jgi:hypothetical protein
MNQILICCCRSLNISTVPLALFMLWFCRAFWWRDSNIHLVFFRSSNVRNTSVELYRFSRELARHDAHQTWRISEAVSEFICNGWAYSCVRWECAFWLSRLSYTGGLVNWVHSWYMFLDMFRRSRTYAFIFWSSPLKSASPSPDLKFSHVSVRHGQFKGSYCHRNGL